MTKSSSVDWVERLLGNQPIGMMHTQPEPCPHPMSGVTLFQSAERHGHVAVCGQCGAQRHIEAWPGRSIPMEAVPWGKPTG